MQLLTLSIHFTMMAPKISFSLVKAEHDCFCTLMYKVALNYMYNTTSPNKTLLLLGYSTKVYKKDMYNSIPSHMLSGYQQQYMLNYYTIRFLYLQSIVFFRLLNHTLGDGQQQLLFQALLWKLQEGYPAHQIPRQACKGEQVYQQQLLIAHDDHLVNAII